MVKKASLKDILREIWKTRSRFISIALLLMLSVSFFSGLRSTKPDMLLSADSYMDAHDMYDIRIQSTLGLTRADISAISKLKGVKAAAGTYQFDALAASAKTTPTAGGKNEDVVISVEALNDAGINAPELLSGRLPQEPDECVAEKRFLVLTGLKEGDSFDIKQLPDNLKDALGVKTFKIVGTVRSPAYLSQVQRGGSTLGNGSVSAYIMIPDRAVTLDTYTEADVLVNGAAGLEAFTSAYNSAVEPVKTDLDTLGKTRGPERHDDLTAKAQSDLQDAKNELSDKQAELTDAENKLADAKKQLEDGRKELDAQKVKAQSELADAEKQLDTSAQQIGDGYAALDASQKTLDEQKSSGQAQLDAARLDLNDKKAQLDGGWTQYNAALAEFSANLEKWNALPDTVKQTMPDKAQQISDAQKQLDAEKKQLDTQQSALDDGYKQLDAQQAAMDQKIADGGKHIQDGYASLRDAETKLADGRKQVAGQKAEADKKFADGEAKLTDAAKEISDNESKVADGQAKLQDGESKIKDAEAKIADIAEGKWYVTDRGDNIGYSNFKDDADRMGAISNIFPIIFFAVAALVCLTTMTRMVDEKRVEIGTYKALGHNTMTTMGKFLYYSLLAWVLGVALGLVAGTLFFPWFIMKAYSILYDLPAYLTPLNIGTAVIAAAAALVCTVGATLLACVETLRETPAGLLRPRAPAPGKRVLLEYMTPVWKRMSFFAKVSARNIFRFKKRLIMTLIGIAGCTALIVTAFGLRNSITDITDKQFGDIFKYSLQAYLKDDSSTDEVGRALKDDGAVDGFLFAQSVSASLKKAPASAQDGYVVVPSEPGRLDGFITLRNRADKKTLTLPNDGAVVTEKLAELLGLHVGDTFTVDADGVYNVKVAGITENYVHHYVYMSPEYYESVFGRASAPNQALIRLKDRSDASADEVSSVLLKVSGVSYVANYATVAGYFRSSMNSVNDVVWILLISAGLLALVVLYNLTNINITERTRELATIKVLGFYDAEVSWYIFRENLILTALGIALGLVGGKFLHGWLVRTVELSFVMFGREVRPSSYIFAAALTAVFAVLVNFVGHRHMKKINMVESLKTNE